MQLDKFFIATIVTFAILSTVTYGVQEFANNYGVTLNPNSCNFDGDQMYNDAKNLENIYNSTATPKQDDFDELGNNWWKLGLRIWDTKDNVNTAANCIAGEYDLSGGKGNFPFLGILIMSLAVGMLFSIAEALGFKR